MTAIRSGPWIRRPIDFLGSGRLAVALLAVLALLLGVYLIVPQFDPGDPVLLQRWLDETGGVGRLAAALQLTDIRSSWLLHATYGLLFVNLLLCMSRRFRAAVILCRLPEEPPLPSPGWLRREVEGSAAGADGVAELLQRRGYRTLVADQVVYGVRGRFAVVGHWIFHVSLLALLVAGAFEAVAPDSFRGSVAVGEGELFDLHATPFLSTNLPPEAGVPSDLPPLRFQLEQIEVRTEGTEVRQLEATFSAPEGAPTPVGINRPYRRGPYQVLVRGLGYMPAWVIVDERGRMRQGAWVKLVPFPLQAEDSFPLGPHGSTARVRFLPDYEADGKRHRTRSHELRNPRFEVRLESGGQRVYEGLLEPDQRVPFRARREFFFLPEIRRYAVLDVIEERSHELIFALLAVMIAGLVIRYARIRKELLVRLGAHSMQVAGQSEILEHLFEEELERLADELGKMSPRSGTARGTA
jgi:hypothetical protein